MPHSRSPPQSSSPPRSAPADFTDDQIKVFQLEGSDGERLSNKVGIELVNDHVEGPNTNYKNEEKSSNEAKPASSHKSGQKCSGRSPLERQGLVQGIVVSPYPPPAVPMGGSRVSSIIASQHARSPLPFMMYSPETHHHSFQPPPAHMGIPRPPMYPLPGQYSHPMFSADYTPLPWHTPIYPISSSAFRGPYPSLPVSSAGLSTLARFSAPAGFIPHTLLPHPPSLPQNSSAIVTPGPKQNISSIPSSTSTHDTHRLQSYSSSSPRNDMNHEMNGDVGKKQRKTSHIKKPLNAFMLFMKETRAKVVAECTLKESAAINQILGRKWHELNQMEQSKYYELAKKERQLHMKLYPGWTARDNYTALGKKKKRKKDKNADGNNPKKCRARFGLDQQESWCKPCRRKKKCIRYTDGQENNESEDNLGSAAGSIGEPPTPDSYIDSDQETIRSNNTDLHSLASPSSVPINLDTPSSSSSSASSRSVNGTLNPNDINNPLSVSQLTQSHHSSSSHHSINPLSPSGLSSISLPSPMTDPPSVTSAPPIVSVT